MSVAFDIRCDTVSAAMPMATSLSQNSGVADWGWPMLAKMLAKILRLHDKGTDNRDAGGVAGDGVVDPVIVVGEPEIAQATGDAACVGAGEEGGVG